MRLSRAEGGPPRIRSVLLRRRSHAAIALNTAAMIDIVFLLLVYFLLIAEFRRDELGFGLDASAVSARAPADPFALPEAPITVRVWAEGVREEFRITIDSPLFRAAPRSLDGLRDAAGGLRGDLLGADQPWVIEAHPDADWGFALGVLNALRLAGYEKIRFGEWR